MTKEEDIFVKKDDLDKIASESNKEQSKILCNYCKRTLTNNKSCIGMCVADNEY